MRLLCQNQLIYIQHEGFKVKGKNYRPHPQTATTYAVKAEKQTRQESERTPEPKKSDHSGTQCQIKHYLKRKVHFNITHLDPLLGRALVLAFGNTNYRLTQSSLLLELKANWTRLENTYSHTLNMKQALKLYTNLTRKRRGEASPMRQMEELEAIMKSYTLQSKDLDGDLEEERIEINKEIDHVRKAIKTIYVRMREEIKKNYLTSEDYFKASLLEWKIRQLGCDLVNLMIVAILEVDIDKVDIIFEHPYPDRSCSKSYLISFLGEERYNAKKIDFVRHYRTARLHHCRNTNFIVCHMCREPITDVYLRCHKKQHDSLEPTIYNSPNVYERHLISVDYLYTNFDEVLTLKQLDEELDYFKYFPTLSGKYACNRFICVECIEKHLILNNADQIINYTCQFCSNQCLCQSCVMAQQLVKALALYKYILKENFQELDDYYQLVKYVNLDHESAQAYMHTRSSFEAAFNKQYEYLYYSGIDEFGNIDEVMTKMQREAVRCFPLVADTSMMISSYMAQVRRFILAERGQVQINPLPPGRKYISKVREVNKSYEELREDRKERDRFQQIFSLRRLPAVVKDFRMKLRLISASHQSQNSPLLEVPFEPYNISQEEMFLDIDDEDDDQELDGRPLQADDMKRIIVGKTEIPFDESDYQLAINVRPECKIPDENQIYLQKALEERILYPDNHKVYGFRATKISRFHENAEEFCDLLEDSDTSEEDDESLDDLQLEKAPSVSVSSFLGKQCQMDEYGIADDICDVSNYDSASSSFIFAGQQPFPEASLSREENEENGEEEDK